MKSRDVRAVRNFRKTESGPARQIFFGCSMWNSGRFWVLANRIRTSFGFLKMDFGRVSVWSVYRRIVGYAHLELKVRKRTISLELCKQLSRKIYNRFFVMKFEPPYCSYYVESCKHKLENSSLENFDLSLLIFHFHSSFHI